MSQAVVGLVTDQAETVSVVVNCPDANLSDQWLRDFADYFLSNPPVSLTGNAVISEITSTIAHEVEPNS